ncbi:hypothetical protein K402DRAFT_205148 [Aulographum hederae CBS 113979]|uniref:Uncharacterized protein n=1 Tax=Aulographum hederae CBS 113979 TaxID=1176131 RepID=A0A6G1HCB2_9PEZI|nr:hypothetical protein K402DRAFT_205148 [Aulographum hederae CBS 113979]
MQKKPIPSIIPWLLLAIIVGAVLGLMIFCLCRREKRTPGRWLRWRRGRPVRPAAGNGKGGADKDVEAVKEGDGDGDLEKGDVDAKEGGKSGRNSSDKGSNKSSEKSKSLHRTISELQRVAEERTKEDLLDGDEAKKKGADSVVVREVQANEGKDERDREKGEDTHSVRSRPWTAKTERSDATMGTLQGEGVRGFEMV